MTPSPEPEMTNESHSAAPAALFDPALFAEAEEPDEIDPEEIAAVEAELDALAQDTPAATSPENPQTQPGESTDKEASPKNAHAGPENPSPAQRSPEDVERMRAARAKARQDALRRGPGATPPTPAASSSIPRPRPGFGPRTPAPGAAGRPYQDRRLTALEEAGGPPPWLGTRWRDMPPEQQREAWVGLRRWVDWFIHEYQVNEQVIPACWFLHPNIVQELYAAMSMEYKAWEEGAPSLTPMMMWHPNVQAMLMRLREMVAEHSAECGKGNHKPLGRMERAYDEQTWRRIAYGRRSFKSVTRPGGGEDPYLIRARVIGPGGTELGISEEFVGIIPIKGSEKPSVVIRKDSTTAATESILHLEAEAVPEAEEILWEKAESWTEDADGQVAEADWQPYDTKEEIEVEEEPGGTPEGTPGEQTPASEIPEESRL